MFARAAFFAERGLVRGDRVFIHYGNSLEFFVDLLALWWMGGCAIPIDARLTAFEIETLARAARPRFGLVSATEGEDLLKTLKAAGAEPLASGEVGDVSRVPTTGTGSLDEAALILFTSGTTGDPKGVVHTHRSLRARWTSLRDNLGTQSYARTLCLLPTHFGHGLICNALFPWLSGADLYVLPPFRADIITSLGALIDEHAITAMSSVPTVWTLGLRLAKPPRKGSLSRVHVGSAPFSAAMWKQVQEWTGTREVFNTYGITETASWVAGTNLAEVAPEDGLVGKPWGAVIKITGADGRELKRGQSGMIWLNTPALMAGYFEREKLTADVVKNGWFMTGDIGALDERGVLYLRGRERDEINKGGMKVYPSDVDGVAAHFPGVTDACAFALPDKLYGQDVGLAVVIPADREATLEKLKEFMRQKLAKHQLPVQWFVIDDIPRTSRGKINREHVAQTCLKPTKDA
jgi:acyl-CoA synthetase (AMP-forming)/AMP-acid ligase II